MEIKLIPFTDRFFASEDGRIFDENFKERNQYWNKDGYRTSSVRLKDRRWVTFGVQRLVMLAFCPVDNSDELTVNHRDLIKANNNRPNLEWLTVEQNNKHAALFRKVIGKPLVYVVDPNGIYKFYYDLEELTKSVGCDALQIWDAIKTETDISGFCIVPFTNTTKIPKQLHAVKYWNGKERPVKVLDIETGDSFSFETLAKTAKHFGVKTCFITLAICKNNKLKLFQRRFVICDIFDDFPEITKEDVEISRRTTGFEVLSYEERNRKFVIYPSAAEFIRSNNLSKKAVTTRLRDRKISKVNDFYFVYYTPEQKNRLFEVVGCPEPNL